MVEDTKKLARLGQIAQLKADLELKKLAAFNQHMSVAREQVSVCQNELRVCYQAVAPLSIAELRGANAQAGRSARELRQAEAELSRLMPRFHAMRHAALREFGRASAISEMSDQLGLAKKREQYNKDEGCA